MVLLNFSIFFWDFFAGQFTQPMFVLTPYYGIGMFYVYMSGVFSSFLVVWSIERTEKFGMGFYMWLPYALIGVFVESYFELSVLKGFWCVILYCVFGLFTGLSADLTFHWGTKKTKWNKAMVAGMTGIVMNLVYFITVVISISTFYKVPFEFEWKNPGTFLGLAYFGLPWLIMTSFIGGLAAFALHNAFPVPLNKK